MRKKRDMLLQGLHIYKQCVFGIKIMAAGFGCVKNIVSLALENVDICDNPLYTKPWKYLLATFPLSLNVVR